MIVSIRATNGGGKSTVVRRLMSTAQGTLVSPAYGLLGPKKPEAYRLKVPGVSGEVYVLGPYHVESGGCDQIQPYDLILDLLKKYIPKGHVVFEGVIVSSSYGRVGRLMEEQGQNAVFAFLDTPLEVCIKNVEGRRAGKGNDKEFNPQNLTSKYNQIVKSKEKIAEAGKLRVVTLNYENAYEQLLGLLRENV